MRYLLFIAWCCLGLWSCKRAENNFVKLKLSHFSDTTGGKLVLKGASFDGALSEYTVLFNDMETKPSQRFSSKELEVVVPVHARSGLITLKGKNSVYQSTDTSNGAALVKLR